MNFVTLESMAKNAYFDDKPKYVEVFDRGDSIGNGVRSTMDIPPFTKVAFYVGRLEPLDTLDGDYSLKLNARWGVDGDPAKYALARKYPFIGSYFNDFHGLRKTYNSRFSFGKLGGERVVWMVTTCAVANGEELFVSYGTKYIQKLYIK
jgi:hypothetical protein